MSGTGSLLQLPDSSGMDLDMYNKLIIQKY